MISKIYQVPEKEFKALVAESFSYNEILRKLNMSNGTSSNDILRRRCAELNLSTDHFRVKGNSRGFVKQYTLEEILVKNSPFVSVSHLREKLLKEKLIEYKCVICGNTGEWQGKPLSLHLDHINGDRHDHRLENLRLLCPNCHSQTDTFGSKNIKKK